MWYAIASTAWFMWKEALLVGPLPPHRGPLYTASQLGRFWTEVKNWKGTCPCGDQVEQENIFLMRNQKWHGTSLNMEIWWRKWAINKGFNRNIIYTWKKIMGNSSKNCGFNGKIMYKWRFQRENHPSVEVLMEPSSKNGAFNGKFMYKRRFWWKII